MASRMHGRLPHTSLHLTDPALKQLQLCCAQCSTMPCSTVPRLTVPAHTLLPFINNSGRSVSKLSRAHAMAAAKVSCWEGGPRWVGAE